MPAGYPSVDVLEEFDDLLYAGDALYQVGGAIGFVLGYQAQQEHDAVLGHHLDA